MTFIRSLLKTVRRWLNKNPDKKTLLGTPTTQADRMQAASKTLQAAGFERYEVAAPEIRRAASTIRCTGRENQKLSWYTSAVPLTAPEYDMLAEKNTSLPARPQDAALRTAGSLDSPRKLRRHVAFLDRV